MIEVKKRCPSCGADLRLERRNPLTVEAACKLLEDIFGAGAALDSKVLDMLRAVERAHGIGLIGG